MLQGSIYDRLAALLCYPGPDFTAQAARAALALRDELPEAAPLLSAFCRQTESLTTQQLQELYTRTFDLDPICSLEVGWHVFGENYERGALLVKIRGQLRRHGIEETLELPDHLTHVLRLLGRLEPEEADALAATYLHPALDRMKAGLAGSGNPFELVLQAIVCLVETRHPRRAGKIPRSAPQLRVLE